MSDYELQQYYIAYLAMAKARYRPAAPGDGCGSISLSTQELQDEDLLHEEATQYASRTQAEADTRQYFLGCPKGPHHKAFIYALEAARILCGGFDIEALALRMLTLAIDELKT